MYVLHCGLGKQAPPISSTLLHKVTATWARIKIKINNKKINKGKEILIRIKIYALKMFQCEFLKRTDLIYLPHDELERVYMML